MVGRKGTLEELELILIDKTFWEGKKVFLTGHSGFKGSWLSLWLKKLGADVKGYSLKPYTTPNLYSEIELDSLIESEIGDIRNLEQLTKSMVSFDPDILIHMAAQPLVRLSYREPVETYEINVIGTVNVFEAARKCSNLKSIVNVTTDKCYENKEWYWGYRENEPMGGHDPYSSSKGCSELVTSAYRKSFMEGNGVGLASARAGNVIGGGDWSSDRLIPDIIRAFDENKPVIVRNPKSTRPWQHVLEPLSGYLLLAQKLYMDPNKYSEGWNFGPQEDDAKSVEYILNKMVSLWPGSNWKLDDEKSPHEAGYLKLDISKAKMALDWNPRWNLDSTLSRIISWHNNWKRGEDIKRLCSLEIDDYMKDCDIF